MKHYDFIFTGTGMAGLMTIDQMIKTGKFRDKSILLLDVSFKKNNNQTWCFWENEKGNWDKIIHTRWSILTFINQYKKKDVKLYPYIYKIIEYNHFYDKIFKKIDHENNITYIEDPVIGYTESGNHVVVKTQNGSYSCDRLINSILDLKKIQNNCMYPLVQQHFTGWHIKTSEKNFDTTKAIFMDFSVPQYGNTRFISILPKSSTEAFVKYTLFSKDFLDKENCKKEIKNYLDLNSIKDYTVLREEQGNIPMTCYLFWKENKKNIINIGIAGGWYKSSTGSAFRKSDRFSKLLCEFLEQKKDFRDFYKKDRFWFYDVILLDILNEKNHAGKKIFSSLFFKGNPNLVLKFLNEETSLWEGLKVILSGPKLIFIHFLFKRIFK